MKLCVYGLPELVDPESLRGARVVVIDLLRATTSMIHAVHAGVREVVPLLEIDATLRYKAGLIALGIPPEEILLGGERSGVRIDGFDFGNSPEDFTPERLAGKTLLFTTTNGTRAVHRAAGAGTAEGGTLLLAGLVNADAVVRRLLDLQREQPSDIHIVCAGTDGHFTEEDLLTAGCLVERLTRLSDVPFELNIEAQTVLPLWREGFSLPRVLGVEPIPVEALAQKLRMSRGGRNLMEIGLGRDILAAAKLDTISIVPEVRDGKATDPSGNSPNDLPAF